MYATMGTGGSASVKGSWESPKNAAYETASKTCQTTETISDAAACYGWRRLVVVRVTRCARRRKFARGGYEATEVDWGTSGAIDLFCCEKIAQKIRISPWQLLHRDIKLVVPTIYSTENQAERMFRCCSIGTVIIQISTLHQSHGLRAIQKGAIISLTDLVAGHCVPAFGKTFCYAVNINAGRLCTDKEKSHKIPQRNSSSDDIKLRGMRKDCFVNNVSAGSQRFFESLTHHHLCAAYTLCIIPITQFKSKSIGIEIDTITPPLVLL